jgi:hypothetical protein
MTYWFAGELRGPAGEFAQANTSFFDVIGSPAGAANVGPFIRDAPIVERVQKAAG